MPEKFDPKEYASTKLRWGFLQSDHPGATVVHVVETGEQRGIPDDFGGDLDYVVARIYDSRGELLAEDHKDVPKTEMRWTDQNGKRVQKSQPFERTADSWRKLCGQATGRALAKLGFPDALADLRPLITWRERMIQLRLLASGGQPVAALGSGEEMEKALTAAGVADPDDEAEHVEPVAPAVQDDVIDAEVVPDEPTPEDESQAAPAAQDVAGLTKPEVVTMLGNMGLPTAGPEAALRARLAEALADDGGAGEASEQERLALAGQ